MEKYEHRKKWENTPRCSLHYITQTKNKQTKKNSHTNIYKINTCKVYTLIFGIDCPEGCLTCADSSADHCSSCEPGYYYVAITDRLGECLGK